MKGLPAKSFPWDCSAELVMKGSPQKSFLWDKRTRERVSRQKVTLGTTELMKGLLAERFAKGQHNSLRALKMYPVAIGRNHEKILGKFAK
jgi:hypothetical protein